MRSLAAILVIILLAAPGPVRSQVWEYPDARGEVIVATPEPTPAPSPKPAPPVIGHSSRPGCQPYPVSANSPSGIVGCQLTGPTSGIASWWGGEVVAANWCVWPWTTCGSVKVTSVDTGLVVEWPVAMYCDCYTGTPKERLVDMPLGLVAALGLSPSQGLYPVIVEPIP
jgi:hypothetical protein